MTTPTPKFEPGVQKFLDEEQTREILGEYKNTTVNLGYKKSRSRFPDQKIKPVTTFSPEIWERFNMPNFDFIKLTIEAGLATPNGNIIIDTTISNSVRKIALLAMVNIKAVKIFTKSYINPKSRISFDGSHYHFESGDLKSFIAHHFPEEEEQIKTVNATEMMKRITTGLERNPCRDRRPLDILTSNSEEGTKSRISFKVDSVISLFTYEEITRLVNTSKKLPHYTMKGYDELLSQALERVDTQAVESSDPIEPNLAKELAEEEHSEPASLVESADQFDDSVMPAIELSPKAKSTEDIKVDQIINLSAIKKILGAGDSITITIQYTKSSGE